MVRKYLDEMVPVNSGIIGQYISPVGPFSEPMYAMVDNDTVAAAPAPTRTRSSKVKKKKSNKPKNDGIIRNHDSVWDYKIQDGKLLTRRKTSDGKWYDITSNDEARSRIESFTGRSIGQSKSQSKSKSIKTPEGGPFGGKTYDELTAILDNAYTNKSNNATPNQKGTLKNSKPRYRTIDTTAGAIDESNDGGFVLDVSDGIYHVLPSTRKQAEARGENDMLAEYIPNASPIRPEFTLDAMTSNQSRQWLAKNSSYGAMPNFITNMLPYVFPVLDKKLYQNNLARRRIPYGPYRELMNAIGIDIFGDNKYYPHRVD